MADMKFIRPGNLSEALDFLALHGPDTEILAGGTDVMVDMREGKLEGKKYLLDIGRIEDLQKIDLEDGELSIGAGVTLTRINQSGLVSVHAPALHKCSTAFGARQVRNKATIGGNIAHASPCGDTVPPLVIHEARALVASKSWQKLIPVETIASGPYRSCLPPDALLIKFLLKPSTAEFADFQKIGRRRELAISRMSLAVMADRDRQGCISFIRIGLGACTPTPHRMTKVEEFLLGKAPTASLIWEAGGLLSQKMIEITGRRPSVMYKEPAIQGLFMRIFYPLVNS